MKTRIPLLVLLLLLSRLASSQILISLLFGDQLNSGKVEFGLDGGVNMAYVRGLESNKTYNLFNIGFYFDIELRNPWRLYTGVLVKSNMGQDALTRYDVGLLDTLTFQTSGSYKQKINYFHVPVMLKYNFNNHFFVALGPQAALRTKAFLTYTYEQGNRTLMVETDNRDLFTRLEFGFTGMFGYKLKKGEGMNIGIKYYYGLTNILKDNATPLYNRSFYLFAGIPIGRAKALEEEAGK